MTEDEYCQVHRGEFSGLSYLNEVMASLPKNQATPTRHKCAYCAYERGR